VNWAKLAADLDTACRTRLLSRRNAAREIGMASSGLSKLDHGHRLSADTLAALVAWLYPDAVPDWITDHWPPGTPHE
jgi:hypothetical protein